MSQSSINFLVGAGISKASGGLLGNDLTHKLLVSNGLYYQISGENFVTQSEPMEEDVLADLYQKFITIIDQHNRLELFQSSEREPNYEDYYSCVDQMLSNENQGVENPMLAGSRNNLKNQSLCLWRNLDGSQRSGDQFKALLQQTRTYIEAVVRRSLSELTPNKESLRIFTKTIELGYSTNIFTLNHDLLLEEYFGQNSFVVKTGFDKENGDLLEFDPGSFENAKVRIIKLHGSLDWQDLEAELPDGEKGRRIIAKVREETQPTYRDSNEISFAPINKEQTILTGTNFKEYNYINPPFFDLLHQFKTRLRQSKHLHCSGYSWGDKGINGLMIDWLNENSENKVFIYPKESEDELKNSKHWRNRWNGSKIKLIPHYFDEFPENGTYREDEGFFCGNKLIIGK